MSLFNVCNRWSTQCTDLAENYDVASLLCARFGLDEHEKDYVVVGSYAGYLSVFYPNFETDRISNDNGYKLTDLLIEIRLHAPILGIFSGKFNSNNRTENSSQLAVLHPNCISIYHIQSVNGVAEHGTQLRLQLLAQYKFQRVAYSFCKGHFGQIKGREFFCIVHVDSTLTIYEQDGISYECQFPGNRPLPAPVVYCERTDSFIRFGAAWNIECFTYQDLSHFSINKSNYQPVWSLCIGEGVIDMTVAHVKKEFASVVIIGERNFICLRDNGKVEFILKLDYTPKCFHSFVIGYYWESTARLITTIISESAKLFIYEDDNIIWAAQYMDEVPISIQRSNLSGLPGGIVSLTENGRLRIGYLGSEPFLFKVPPLNMQEMTFSEAHKELLQLEEEIKEAVEISDMESVNRLATDDVRIHFYINSEIATDSDAILLDVSADVAVMEFPSCTGSLKLKCRVDLAELQVTFNMSEGIRCSQESVTFVDINAGMTEALEMDFYIAELLHVHSSRVDAIISFINTKGIPRVIQQSAYLPLGMFFKVRQPQKLASIKFIFNITSKSLMPKLSIFFPEFITWESEVSALGLMLMCPGDKKSEEIITIVAAKTSSRLRVQSDTLETFPMILERLMKITLDSDKGIGYKGNRNHKSKGLINTRTRNIMATPFIPIQEILHRVDVHREMQENIHQQTAEMDTLWQQFKTLQRKLQEKSEDEPKETLVLQIEENYDLLIAEGDKLMDMRKEERRQRCDLTCSIAVADMIISTLYMEEKIVNVILSVLCTPVEDWTELSWEEAMSPGIDMLHHYGPLNRFKDSTNNNVVEVNTSYELFDYSRFRRHFVTLFERIIRITTMQETMPKEPSNAVESRVYGNDVENLMNVDFIDLNNDTKMGNITKQCPVRHSTLEAVEDEDEEYDEEDLRIVGYKKDYGKHNSHNTTESSAWVNENYELPSSEELFEDLGIWW